MSRKFKKIEEIVKQEEAKACKMEKLKILYKIKQEKEEQEKMKLPGKKLPIWKKRVFGTADSFKHIPNNSGNIKKPSSINNW